LFQNLRRASKLPEASGCVSWQQSPKLRDRKFYGLIPDGTLAGKEGLLEIINSIRTGKPLTNRKLLVWDPELFKDVHLELYSLQDNTGKCKWIRLEPPQGSVSLTYASVDQIRQTSAKIHSDQRAPAPHCQSAVTGSAEFDGISTTDKGDSYIIYESDSEGVGDRISIAGSDTDTKHPYGAGYAWRGAHQVCQTMPGRYSAGP
jgi:hypothetical protein